MQHPWFYSWRHLSVRLIVGWLVVGILPALLLWRGRFLAGHLLKTEINSLLLASVGVLLAMLGLQKLAEFPGQRSLGYVLPTLVMVMIALAGLLIVFRLPYSLYYLSFASLIGVVFFFASYLLEQKISESSMAYIPLGRCIDIEQRIPIQWYRIDSPSQTISQLTLSTQADANATLLPIQAIVADLSTPQLDSEWQRFLTRQTLQGMPVYNYQQIYESLTGRSPIQHLHENDLGSLLPSQSYLHIKQIIDMLAVLAIAPIVVPIALITALIIRLESRGNAIFVQERVGQGGRLFKIYKFRSMTTDAEKDGAKLAQENDARVTRVGKFIRKTRIDELPQFINVLKGDMSLIGPRPEQLSFVKDFEQKIPFYNYRHIVKPGTSGWAQVTQGYAGNEDETALKIQYDFYYIKHISFALDILIVFKTIQTMLTGFGAR